MSVRKRTGFLSPNQISEMVWDSEIEEAGTSNDCVFYLGNGILCTFRQPLKYICFSFSFLDEIRKYYVETLDSSSWKIYWKWWCKSVDCNSTQQNLVSLGSWQWRSQNVACELWLVLRKKLLMKFWESMVCVWCKMVFLKLPGKGITTQIFTLKFTVHTSSPKQKHK